MLVALGASRPCHLFCTKLWIFRIQVTITFSLWNKTAQDVGKLGKMMELEWQRTKHKWIVPGRRENCGTHAVLLPLVSEFKQPDNCPREETEAFFMGGTDWLYILIHWSHPSGKKMLFIFWSPGIGCWVWNSRSSNQLLSASFFNINGTIGVVSHQTEIKTRKSRAKVKWN